MLHSCFSSLHPTLSTALTIQSSAPYEWATRSSNRVFFLLMGLWNVFLPWDSERYYWWLCCYWYCHWFIVIISNIIVIWIFHFIARAKCSLPQLPLQKLNHNREWDHPTCLLNIGCVWCSKIPKDIFWHMFPSLKKVVSHWLSYSLNFTPSFIHLLN